ncbi:hypothetical protein NDU88_002711, partial [Pleurodeles waltl]
SSVLQLASRSLSLGIRCFFTGLVTFPQLRLSPFHHDQQGPSTSQTSACLFNSHSPVLVVPGMVSHSSGTFGGFSLTTSVLPRPTVGHSSTSSPPHRGQYPHPIHLENFRNAQSFPLISTEASQYISNSWAPGTKKAYKSALSLWYSWCLGKHIHPF